MLVKVGYKKLELNCLINTFNTRNNWYKHSICRNLAATSVTPAQDRKPEYNTAGDSPAVEKIFFSAVGKDITQSKVT
jgi:hypothetical protein